MEGWEKRNGAAAQEEQKTRERTDHYSEKEKEAERRALYLLSETEGMHREILGKMYEYAGSFAEAYCVPAEEYRRAGLLSGWKKGAGLLYAYDRRKEREEKLLRDYEAAKREGVRLISLFDTDYPQRLRPLPDAPYLLYVRGALPADEKPAAALIGARMCSDYGRETAAYFAEALSAAGVQIISGMAAGIDGAAQSAALSAGGESFAVLGNGVDLCYPRENYAIYKRMANGQGGLISEFPRKSPPLPFHFVLRNRIIAGLCDVLLVLEARERSGTSITVSCALEQGKEIFALPGRISDPLGRGSNALLRDGASVLTEPADVLSALGLPLLRREAPREKDPAGLAKAEKIVYSFLDSSAQHVEVIAQRTGFGLARTTDILLHLELMGLSVSPMSGYYRKPSNGK